jgi:hypothetical protein
VIFTVLDQTRVAAASGDPLYDFGRILHSAILASDLSTGIEAVNLARKTYGDAPWLPVARHGHHGGQRLQHLRCT